MIEINIEGLEQFNDSTNEFVTLPSQRLVLEHSLISLSKWESKWMKPFLGPADKTDEEMYDYIRCMIISDDDVDLQTILRISRDDIVRISEYIQSPMTATTITNNSRASREVVTSEVIYYSMVALNIPFECQHWHLNRLTTLINVCNIKNSPPKKANSKEILSRNRSLNEARKKALATSG